MGPRAVASRRHDRHLSTSTAFRWVLHWFNWFNCFWFISSVHSSYIVRVWIYIASRIFQWSLHGRISSIRTGFRTLELDALNSMGAWNMLPVSAECLAIVYDRSQKYFLKMHCPMQQYAFSSFDVKWFFLHSLSPNPFVVWFIRGFSRWLAPAHRKSIHMLEGMIRLCSSWSYANIHHVRSISYHLILKSFHISIISIIAPLPSSIFFDLLRSSCTKDATKEGILRGSGGPRLRSDVDFKDLQICILFWPFWLGKFGSNTPKKRI